MKYTAKFSKSAHPKDVDSFINLLNHWKRRLPPMSKYGCEPGELYLFTPEPGYIEDSMHIYDDANFFLRTMDAKEARPFLLPTQFMQDGPYLFAPVSKKPDGSPNVRSVQNLAPQCFRRIRPEHYAELSLLIDDPSFFFEKDSFKPTLNMTLLP